MATGGSYISGTVAVTNAAAGTYTQDMGFTLFEHFNILTQTITDATLTIEGTLDDSNWNDVTGDLFRDSTTGVPITALAANSEYIADTYMTYKNLRVKWVLVDGTNAVNFQWMVKKGGGR